MHNIVFFACTAAIATIIWQILRKTFFSITLPSPSQAPWYRRLLLEPDPQQVATWTTTIENEGLIRYYGILNQERILVTSPQGVRDILTTQAYSFRKPEATTTILRSILGDGLVTAEGKAHKAQRKLLQPVFNVRQVKDMYPLFWKKTTELVEVLRGKTGKDVHLNDLMGRTALDIIGAGGLGIQLQTLANPSDEFLQAYMQASKPSRAAQRLRLLALVLPGTLLNLLPLERNKVLRGAANAVQSLIRTAVAERKQSAIKNDGKDIISILLNSGAIDDIETLSEQGMTFIGGGHDTASQTLLWAIYESAQHPNMQERLRQEVRTVLPTSQAEKDHITTILEQLESLPYLSAFINEILRMYPAIPNLHREAIEPVRVNGVEFPKGSSFMVSIGGINRTPGLWSTDPMIFDPERWLENANGGVKAREGFLSFGSGPKTCIGERFARTEIACLLAGLVANFDMEYAGQGPPRLAHGGVTRMAEPLAVRVEALNTW